MRVFRAVYNFTRNSNLDDNRNKILPPHPVEILNTTNQWVKVKRKKTLIRASDLPKWYRTLESILLNSGSLYAQNIYAHARFTLFTGLRGTETRRLCIDRKNYLKHKKEAKGYYDKHAQLIHFLDQKNKEESILNIPLC